MRVTSLLKIALLVIVSLAASTCLWAQWATPTIDGSIGNGEYGTNNQLNNAGNTGQTWYMTWDANNLYVGIVNANIFEGRVLYVRGIRRIRRRAAQRRRQPDRLQLRRQRAFRRCLSARHS